MGKIPGLQLLSSRADYLEFRLGDGVDPNEILSAAMKAGQVIHFELVEPSLDQIFVEKVVWGMSMIPVLVKRDFTSRVKGAAYIITTVIGVLVIAGLSFIPPH